MTALKVHDEPFDRIRGEWAGLLQQIARPIPFLTPAWQRVWLDHFQGDRDVRVLTARDGERLLGVAPLLVKDSSAEFIGHYSICDYMDAAVTPGFERAFYEDLLAHTAASGITSMDLRGLRDSSPSLAPLCDAAAAGGWNVEREDEAVSPAVELQPDWESYLGTLSKKDRHELRRKMRRLESAGGDVQLRIITEAAEAREMLPTLFHLMRISNHHKEEFLDRPGMETFFHDMTGTMADEGMLRFYFLMFDGVPVATVLNFDIGGGLYMYNSGYEPTYSHYAVGLMSKAMLLRDAIENGRTLVDFMRGDESYKYDLGGKDQQVYRVVLSR